MCESLGDPLGGDLPRDRRIVRGVAANQRDVEPVALVAGAGVGDVVELDGALPHALPPSIVMACRTNDRSIRQEAEESRGSTRRRTPAPPAGPAQYSASTSSSRSSTAAASDDWAAKRSRTSSGATL